MKNATFYQKRQIVEYLKANGYRNFDDTRYHLVITDKEPEGWQRHIYVTILLSANRNYYIVAELKAFENLPGCDIRNKIIVQRNIRCVEELQQLENNIDELLTIRPCLFKTFSDSK